MITAGLKDFATQSRSALIDQMQVRIRQLLADTKTEAEFPREVKMLHAAVNERGLESVAETAAYTWFNRLTATRYMDANGFSGSYGVVSPAADSASVLPEILTRAQSGEFSDAIPPQVRVTVTDLLTGKRTADDPDREAYATLLNALFRAWHEPMPEVFPAAVDWISLLTPVDILTPRSVRAKTIERMDKEACDNVEVVGWLYQFYNADVKDAINDAKTPIDAAQLAPVTQLFTPHWIVRYLVENSLGRLWLRSRPSSRLREQMDYYVEPVEGQTDTGITVESPEQIRIVDPACGSGHMLTYAFDLLFAIYEEEGHARGSIPELILTHNLRGLEIDERAAQLASFALAMKARAKDRRFLARRVQPNIIRIQPISFDPDEVAAIVEVAIQATGNATDAETLTRLLYAFEDADTFGSLIRVDTAAVNALEAALDELENGKDAIFTVNTVDRVKALINQAASLIDNQYHVVVANPPYLGSGRMGQELRSFARKQFPRTKSDLYAMFIERNATLCAAAGSVAMVTMHSWMFLSSYKKLRANFPSWGQLTSMAHFGTRGFDSISGEIVQTTAFIIDTNPGLTTPGIYFRLIDGKNEEQKRESFCSARNSEGSPFRYTAKFSDFEMLPDSPVAYWVTEKVRNIFQALKPLGDIAEVRCGMNTGDNATFVREWWEISRRDFAPSMMSEEDFRSRNATWCPYNKGGEARRWWGNQSSVLRYDEPSAEFLKDHGNHLPSRDKYFRRSVSWSKIGGATFRLYPPGFVFDGAGMSIFNADPGNQNGILGFLNSTASVKFLGALAPTVNVQSGDVANIPVKADPNQNDERIDELVSIFRSDWDCYERSWDFARNPLVKIPGTALDKLAHENYSDVLARVKRAQFLEEANNRHYSALYELTDETASCVPPNEITLTQNPFFRYAPAKDAERGDQKTLFIRDLAKELLSYAVGCMMGRYSLDKPGLILADAGATISEFDRLVPDARFRADDDGIIPITSQRYFPDDIVARLREFLIAAFGREHVDANIAWLEHALGSGKRKPLETYFVKDFYTDHVQTYSKRPIYWQVSSPKGTFNALFYLHRYTPATLGQIHQSYAEELLGKLTARVDTVDHDLLSASNAEKAKLTKERNTLSAQISEVRQWIDESLFPKASEEITLNLDDGVKANYPKLTGVVKKVTGL